MFEQLEIHALLMVISIWGGLVVTVAYTDRDLQQESSRLNPEGGKLAASRYLLSAATGIYAICLSSAYIHVGPYGYDLLGQHWGGFFKAILAAYFLIVAGAVLAHGGKGGGQRVLRAGSTVLFLLATLWWVR